MRACITTLFAMVLFCCTSTLYAGQQTLVLQQGLNGYAGAADTWISDNDWDSPPQYSENYGLNAGLSLERDGGDNPLLRFDLSAISSNSVIISAKLELYNTTDSAYTPGNSYKRRIKLHKVLQSWVEGNQVESPIDAAGKFGATGDYAVQYFAGEGTDIPWAARGMSEGADYTAKEEDYAEVSDPGWYAWDITALAQSWVRGQAANYGVVLRDATGYEDDHQDMRVFHSSQHNDDSSLRPRLTIVYNPDSPSANAGPDVEMLDWSGQAVALDGSGSSDRPGGDDGSLTFSWSVAAAAFGSSLSGVVAAGQTASLIPDVAGEYDIRLTVTNNVGETAEDVAHIRVLSMRSGHPRLLITPELLAKLQARAVPGNSRWAQLKAEANEPDGYAHSQALVYAVTGQTSYAASAISWAESEIADGGDYPTKAADLALIYDWCYDQLTDGQKQSFISYFIQWAADSAAGEHSSDISGWGNYWPRYSWSMAAMGLATYGDAPDAAQWMDIYRHDRFRDYDLPLLDMIAAGGGWPEGTVYDWIANNFQFKAVEAWRTATSENLYLASDWFAERAGYFLLHRYPGLAEEWGDYFHPYPSTGDAERNRGSMANYGRIMALMLCKAMPSAPYADQLMAYLSAGAASNSMSFLYHDEFLFYDPDLAQTAPTLLTHYTEGLGMLFARSHWPSAAADTDPAATYLTFQCGDHFSYHQHFDQNSFTLFKHADLAVDSGVYSGDGLSYHDRNYYVRTIAHNTLIVYNPQEDFQHSRPDAESNDGGQRSVYPGSRSPDSLEYWKQYATQYETGTVDAYEDASADAAPYTYIRGDATAAYNNPAYNQAMDSGMESNVAKVSRFQRELAYLRPTVADGEDFVVLLDRVGVTEAQFSGENTKLLFHTLGEPSVLGVETAVSAGETLYSGAETAAATYGDGKLFMAFLLPESRNVRKVGGRGEKAFWVFGEDYDWQWSSTESQPRPVNDFESVPYGEWRLELEPADNALDHVFLTVLHPAAATLESMPAAFLLDAGHMAGVHIAGSHMNRVALFSGAQDGADVDGVITYSFTPTATTAHLLCNLPAGQRYDLANTLSGGVRTITLTPGAGGAYQASTQGVLSFVDGETPAGRGLALPGVLELLLEG